MSLVLLIPTLVFSQLCMPVAERRKSYRPGDFQNGSQQEGVASFVKNSHVVCAPHGGSREGMQAFCLYGYILLSIPNLEIQQQMICI